MDHVLEGGTDAGSMVVFDPAALPEDFDARQRHDAFELLEELTQAGRLYWLETHADGGYSLGVYVGDRLPDRLQSFAQTIAVCDPFHVPGGRLYFTGVEYAFREDDSRLRKYPGVGEVALVPAGTYRAEFFEFDYPGDIHEDVLRQRLPAQFGKHQAMRALIPIGCVALLALLGTLVLLFYTWRAALALPIELGLIALPLILSRMPAYREAEAAYKTIQKEFPDFAVLLQAPA
jgi:hypothetical protein